MVAWMVYMVLVGTLVAASARLLDPALSRGRRWLWLGASFGTWCVPLIATWLRSWWADPRGIDIVFGPILPVLDAPLAGRMAATGGWAAPSPNEVAGLAWLAASLIILAWLAVGAARVRRMRASWTRRSIDGRSVLVSGQVGPAVVGVLDPDIVVPAWVIDLPPADRALILSHEDQHRRRGDPLVLAAGLIQAALMPWNPAAWWSFGRLREAVELDCDQRVVRGGPGPVTAYARLLLDVGSRSLGTIPWGRASASTGHPLNGE